MQTLAYQLHFHTPAFLGDSTQSGRWRTPPIKALLRQWWRVAYAADHHFAINLREMHVEEGVLFGHAWLDEDRDNDGNKVSARKSLVRLRLSHWKPGALNAWEPLANVAHPEVQRPVGSDLYMGYGPLVFDRGTHQPKLKSNAAIQANASAQLMLAVPHQHSRRIQQALWLMDRYGTLGGRSRNGWGSFGLIPVADQPALDEASIQVLRPWRNCLALDWAHAIGSDSAGRPLIWQTAPHADWKTLMTLLAKIKIALRTGFKFPEKQPDGQVHDRHWLGYPVTNHVVQAWGGNARLPGTLRFKIRKPSDGKLVGVIFHVPCCPIEKFKPDLHRIEAVWQTVHNLLDQPVHHLTRVPS